MGDRAQVLLFEEKWESGTTSFYDEPIYIYTHWGGYNVKQNIANALERGEDRWSDPSYLARIIFSEFVKDDIEGTTGIGLSRNYQDSSPSTDFKVYLSFDVESQKVKTLEREYTYQEFVREFANADL